MPHRRHGQRGTITIEFALIFPALVAVLFGMIDGGRLMGSRVMLSQATIAATRVQCLSSYAAPSNLDQAVRDAAPMLNGISVASFGCTGVCGIPRSTGDVVTTTVQYTFRAGYFTSLSKTLSQTSRMVCE